MICNYFGRCGSCTLYDLEYDKQKAYKLKKTEELFSFFGIKNYEWFSSCKTHYRNRAEFAIWHDKEKDTLSYAMNKIDKSGKFPINECLKVDKNIHELMPKLLRFLESNEVLKRSLFGVEFLSVKNDMLVTLLYHKKLDESWKKEAKKCKLGIKIVGRSRGVKIALGDDFVEDLLEIEGKNYEYKIKEGSFSQPNRSVNERMISWVLRKISRHKKKDLLELYCGHGNFTIPLSFAFGKVLAAEISKTSIYAARKNAKMNNAENISFARLGSCELAEALKGEKEFRRLENLDIFSFDFSHILVDPPRSGLDADNLNFLKNFQNIIYISCNQTTLSRDLQELYQTHDIEHFALFDQFPHTLHIESGVILRKR